MPPGKRTRFVPPIVFASTVVAVTPSCGVIGRDRDIVLAIAGFTGCPVRDAGADAATTGGSGGAANPCGTGGNSSSSGGRVNTGGAEATGGVIVLAVMGFSGGGSH
jgi:hypothetical protein